MEAMSMRMLELIPLQKRYLLSDGINHLLTLDMRSNSAQVKRSTITATIKDFKGLLRVVELETGIITHEYK